MSVAPFVRRLFHRLLLPVFVAALAALVVLAARGASASEMELAAAGALGFGGTAAWVVARGLRRRWETVLADAQTIASGAQGRRSPDLADDELGDLERRLLDLVRSLREREAAARNRAVRLETVLRTMADGVVVLEADGTISFANGAAANLLDIESADRLLGSRLVLVCRNPDLVELLEDMRATGTPRTREVTLDGADRRTLLVSAAPIRPGEASSGVVLVLHDVTHVRRLESMRADFVANVSHELRTPLTAIRGYAETLLGGAIDDPARARQFVQVIERHSERLSRLIDDLLTLSDLELGRTELRRESLELDDVVHGVLEVLESKAERKAIELAAEIPPGLPSLVGDRDRIEQVLINLVDNAIKYTPAEGRVRVSATVSSSVDGGRRIGIDVADTGIGIPEKDIPRLTERFYRVDRARSREIGGTGLGLAIVKHIVQAHGGSLSIDSRVNQGTTIRVELPVAGSAEG